MAWKYCESAILRFNSNSLGAARPRAPGEDVGDEPDIDDRFEALRVPVDRVVELRLDPEGEWTRASAGNLSMSGLFVHTEEAYEPGTLLEFRLKLREGEPQIRCKAAVLWRREEDAGPDRPRGVGTRFVHLDLESKYAISCLVERYVQLGGMPFQLAPDAPQAAPPPVSRLDRRSALSLVLAFTAGLAIGAASLWLVDPADGVLRATERSGSGRQPHASAGRRDVDPPPVEDVVHAWALAWSRKDVEAYLGFYSEDFAPSSGLTLDVWKTTRRQRLSRPGSVEVGVSGLEIEAVAADRVTARFDQTYASPGYRDRVAKELELVLEEPGWRVVREEALGEPDR